MREPLDLRDDAALEEILAGLHGESGLAPFEIDVADRVMARIAFAGPVARTEVGLAQFGRWAAAAAAAGIALVWSVASKAPSLPEIVGEVGVKAADGTALAVKTGSTLTLLAASLAKAGAVLFDAARATTAALAPPQAAMGAAVAVSVLIMLGVTAFVVGRDFRATSR